MNETLGRWMGYWRTRWNVFVYNYAWDQYVYIVDGWVAKGAMAVPFIGYLILFNDSIAQQISFNKIANEAALTFGLPPLVRLQLIYFGLIFLGTSNIIYRLRRPYVLRIGTNQFDFVERALSHFTISDYIRLNGIIRHEGHFTQHGKYYDAEFDAFLNVAMGESSGRSETSGVTADWVKAKSKYEGLMRSILIETFFRNSIRRRYWLSLCLALAFVGYSCLAIPSADLFLKVIRVTF